MNEEVRICAVLDEPGISARAEGKLLFGWDWEYLKEKLARAGILRSEFALCRASDLSSLSQYPNLTVLVPFGEYPLGRTTGKQSISKWHLSPLECVEGIPCRKAIPTFSLTEVRRDLSLGLYVEMALRRARLESRTKEFSRKPKIFQLNPTLEETHKVLHGLQRRGPEDWLSVDIETGRGQINTVGFAWSASQAIAINTLPERCSAEEFLKLWQAIGAVLEGPSRKICQNGIYETLYFARYGIRMRNLAHDTMNAQKFLWPEFEKGLDTVGRFYTNETYWKDTGKVSTAEGKKRDWGDIRNWPEHYRYNCLDTTGTYEAAMKQREDLLSRGQLKFFDEFLMPLHTVSQEMCLRGLPLSEELRAEAVSVAEAELEALKAGLSQEINPGSPKQKLELFRSKGYRIPVRKGKPSVDELSLKKLRLKYPDDPDIPLLLRIAKLSKSLSSYLRVQTDPLDGRVRFSLDICGTETGRWSSNSDPWGRGFNAQTIPKYAKKMIKWTAEGGAK